jgi:hypothetical protein
MINIYDSLSEIDLIQNLQLGDKKKLSIKYKKLDLFFVFKRW